MNKIKSANAELKSNMDQLMSQYTRLMSVQEALQSDLNQARQQEEKLRAEIQSNSDEKGDLHGRLMTIQWKVRDIESSHELEIKRLASTLDNAEAANRKLSQQVETAQRLSAGNLKKLQSNVIEIAIHSHDPILSRMTWLNKIARRA